MQNVVLENTATPASEESRRKLLFFGRLSPSSLPLLLIGFVSLFGLLGLKGALENLWFIWTSDDLRSIGMLIPVASFFLIWRCWKREQYPLQGRWWWVGLVFFAYLVEYIHQSVTISSVWGTTSINFIPTALPLWIYGNSIVLLFMGTKIWKKLWFPIGLLLLAQPVPGLSKDMVDIPMQSVAASVARWFAESIGFAPTTPQLHLMFSPTFGMFIAPGCDGIRGSITMAYLMLVLGYLKGFSKLRWLLSVAGAVLLGYLFNLVRLCVLVLYYRAAIGHEFWENYAKQADYCIGATLFVSALLLFYKIGVHPAKQADQLSEPQSSSVVPLRSELKKVGVTAGLVVCLALGSSFIQGSRTSKVSHRHQISTAVLLDRLPVRVGQYDLLSSTAEQQNGKDMMISGSYQKLKSSPVTLGVWVYPGFSFHDSNDCYLMRGFKPITTAIRSKTTDDAAPADFNIGYFLDGEKMFLVATAYCSSKGCMKINKSYQSSHLFMQVLNNSPFEGSNSDGDVLPIMVRTEAETNGESEQLVEKRLNEQLDDFLTDINLTKISKSFQ